MMRKESKRQNSLLYELFSHIQTEKEFRDFFHALFTPTEQENFCERILIVKYLLEGETHRKISEKTGASLATISRGSREIKHGSGIFRTLFQRL